MRDELDRYRSDNQLCTPGGTDPSVDWECVPVITEKTSPKHSVFCAAAPRPAVATPFVSGSETGSPDAVAALVTVRRGSSFTGVLGRLPGAR